MGYSSYQSTKILVGKWLIVLAATFLPPVAMMHSARDAAVMHGLEERLRETRDKDVLEPGDVAWVVGAVRSSPLELTPRLVEFTESLRVVQRVEEYRNSGKHKRWKVSRENEWIVADA